MENKKIVIKKILSQEFKTVDENVFVDENLENTIDDKFFEPINEENIVNVLKDISKISISHDTIKDKLSEEELKRAGITLGKRIFELAQVKRETRDNVYLNAFNVVLESYRVSDQYRILKLANQFFLSEYREYIENRGERPEILSQIMRRVGKANETKYRHIINGIDLEKFANNIFEILKDNDPYKRERIKNLLYGNNKNEILAIRSKINIFLIDLICERINSDVLQYKQINKKNEDILFEIFADKEENKKYFYTYGSPEEKIKYTLIGRDKKELELIKERYDRLTNKENALEQDLKIVFKEDEKTFNEIFEGLNYEKIATRIKDILFPDNALDVGKEITSPGAYHKIFYKVPLDAINILDDLDSLEAREIFCREKILKDFSFLKQGKATKVNEMLQRIYGISLIPEIFPELFSFDPEKIAFDVQNALFLRLEVFKVVEILMYYSIDELCQIKKAYETNFNSDMTNDILDYAFKALKSVCDDNLKSAYEAIFSGLSRLTSSFDLISYLLKENDEFPIWHAEHVESQENIDKAYEFASIINDETVSLDEIEKNLLSFIKKQDKNSLTEIKQVLYKLLEPKQSASQIITEIFGKITSETLIQSIEDFSYCKSTCNKILLPKSSLILQNQIVNNDLNFFKEKLQEENFEENALLENLPKIEMYSLFLVRNIYTYMLRQENVGAFLFDALNLNFECLKAIECIFNAKFTSLRRLLKELNNKKLLSDETFAILFLRLENIPENITEDIDENIEEKKIRQLIKLFSTYPKNQRTFEDIYEVLAPKEIETPKLKQLIKDSEAKLTDINECILYIDKFFPALLAKKLHEVILGNINNGESVYDNLVSLFTGTLEPNLIPEDVNWKIEQNYISTLYYKVLFKETFIDSLRKINMDKKELIEVSKLVYGSEIVDTTLVIEGIVEDDIIDEQETKVLKEILPLRQKRFLMIARDFFNSYSLLPKKLEEYVEKNEEIKKLFFG